MKMSGSFHPRTSRRRRAFGQHFLSSSAAARRIVEHFAPQAGETILEIGPGRGALTEHLLQAGARLIAVEVDSHLAEELNRRFGTRPGFSLIHADILSCDITAMVRPGPARVLANLPYSITGEVLIRLFGASAVLICMMLMLQREVVNRLIARPGGRTYGSLSVLAQYFTSPRAVMSLGPASFTPPPAVSSTLVAMPFRRPRELPARDEHIYPAFIRMLFAHRRRTLLNNLRAAVKTGSGQAEADDSSDSMGGKGRAAAGGAALACSPEECLARAGIAADRRPETLAREECLRLFRAARG